MPGKKGSFTAKNARVIKLKSAGDDALINEVILSPKEAFALTKPVQFQVDGVSPEGLQDSKGRLIDGDHDGEAGGNTVALLRAKAAILSAVVALGPGADPSVQAWPRSRPK